MGRREDRGVVMSVKDGWAVVLSADGMFQRIRTRPAWRVGDDVLLITDRTPARRAAPWLGAVGAAAMAAVATFTVMSLSAAGQPIGYVEIVGTHDVRLSVNRAGQILSAQGKIPASLRVARGEAVGTAVEALAKMDGEGAGGLSLGGVVVLFYPSKGQQAPELLRQKVQMAAGQAQATFFSSASDRKPVTSHSGLGAAPGYMAALGEEALRSEV